MDKQEFLSWPPMERLIDAIHGGSLFAEGPVTLARAPGRLDVMGGIADYTGSLVCEMPLSVAAGVAVQRRLDGRIVCRSAQIGQTVDLDAEMLDTRDPLSVRRLFPQSKAWARYLIGCLWWLRERSRKLGEPTLAGVTILIDSDVPLGGGVSSSAAIEVATMTALCALKQVRLQPMALSAACQAVENHVVGAPCGVMDQVASAMGRAGSMLEILCQPDPGGMPAQVLGEVPVPKGFKFVGVHSGVSHEVSGDPYTDTRVAAFMARRILSEELEIIPADGHLANVDATVYLQSLRPVLPQTLGGGEFLSRYGGTGDPVTTVNAEKDYHVRAAADHHVLEMARVREFVDLIKGQSEAAELGQESLEAQMIQAGHLMYESHRSYGECARLGHPMTDRLVELARDLGSEAGFLGAKITGGGGGGTVALLIRDQREVLDRVAALRARYAEETGRQTILFEGSSPGAAALGTITIEHKGQQ